MKHHDSSSIRKNFTNFETSFPETGKIVEKLNADYGEKRQKEAVTPSSNALVADEHYNHVIIGEENPQVSGDTKNQEQFEIVFVPAAAAVRVGIPHSLYSVHKASFRAFHNLYKLLFIT